MNHCQKFKADQIDNIYVIFFLYFGLHQNHVHRMMNGNLSIDGVHVTRNIINAFT